MSDQGADKGEQKAVDVTAPTRIEDTRQQELLPPADLLRRVLEIEQQRIDSTNRRTDVALQAVKASDESDRRQFEYQMEKLHSEERAGVRRDSLAKIVVSGAGVFSAGVVVLFLGMAFFGTAQQSDIAMKILGTLAIGGGGYGVISGLTNLVRRLLRNSGVP